MAKAIRALVIAAVALSALAYASTAFAKEGDVRVAGTCTSASSAKLKLSPEDGRIEVEFEVDQNRNGVTWRVVLRRNGSSFFRGSAVTRAPSGSFELRRLAADGSGPETISARATNARGEVCTARASSNA